MVIDMGYTGVRWCLIFHITFLKLELWNGSLGLNQPFLEFQAWSPCLLISTLLYCLPLHSIKVIALGHPIVVGRLLPWVYEPQQPWHDHSLNQTAHQYQSTKCMLKAMTMNKGGTVLKQVPIEIPRGEIMELSRDHSRLWPSVSLSWDISEVGVSLRAVALSVKAHLQTKAKEGEERVIYQKWRKIVSTKLTLDLPLSILCSKSHMNLAILKPLAKSLFQL